MANLPHRPSAPQPEIIGHPLPSDQLSPAVFNRLAAEGIRTLEAWRALGRRRHKIFGVTRRVAEQLDVLAKAAQR